MTENEAISRIKDHMEIHRLKEPRAIYITVALSMAITALKEIQQYREIGTAEECRKAVDKQKAKVPDYESNGYADGYMVYDTWICPNCGKKYEVDYDDYKHCPECGQAIDDNLEGMEDV